MTAHRYSVETDDPHVLKLMATLFDLLSGIDGRPNNVPEAVWYLLDTVDELWRTPHKPMQVSSDDHEVWVGAVIAMRRTADKIESNLRSFYKSGAPDWDQIFGTKAGESHE